MDRTERQDDGHRVQELESCFQDIDTTSSVLARLPTKNLCGIKRVSREWHDLLSERSFVRLQLKRTEPLSGYLFQEKYQWCKEDIESVSYIPAEAHGTEVKPMDLKFLPESVVLQSSVNGLLCCRSCLPCRNPIIYVCNPVNKEWVSLPYPESDFQDSIALVFDPFVDPIDISTNFEVIRVREATDDKKDVDDIPYEFDIYSSKTRGWKKAEETCYCPNPLYKNKGVFVKGNLYWLTRGDKILMFDVKNELSFLITVPIPSEAFTSIPETCIGEADGQLHFVFICEDGLQLWVLEEQFTSQWNLKYLIALDKFEEENREFVYDIRGKIVDRLFLSSTPWMDPLVFKDGLLFMRISSEIFLFDFGTGKLKRLCNLLQLGPNSLVCPIALPYTMSLVPLDYI